MRIDKLVLKRIGEQNGPRRRAFPTGPDENGRPQHAGHSRAASEICPSAAVRIAMLLPVASWQLLPALSSSSPSLPVAHLQISPPQARCKSTPAPCDQIDGRARSPPGNTRISPLIYLCSQEAASLMSAEPSRTQYGLAPSPHSAPKNAGLFIRQKA